MKFKLFSCLALALVGVAYPGSTDAAAYTLVFPLANQISGPDTPSNTAAWLAAMQRFRIKQRARLNYDDSIYRFKPLNWTQHNPHSTTSHGSQSVLLSFTRPRADVFAPHRY
jgi:hypothetical protein